MQIVGKSENVQKTDRQILQTDKHIDVTDRQTNRLYRQTDKQPFKTYRQIDIIDRRYTDRKKDTTDRQTYRHTDRENYRLIDILDRCTLQADRHYRQTGRFKQLCTGRKRLLYVFLDVFSLKGPRHSRAEKNIHSGTLLFLNKF